MIATVQTDSSEVTMSDVPEIPVIEMVRPMPGFSDDQQFALVRLDEDGTLCEFRSITHDDLRFLVVTPGVFFAGYAPEITDEDVAALELAGPEEALVLVVLNAGMSLEQTTGNLVAPIIVNTVNRRALQVVLDDRRHPIAAPLLG
ncbi:flagellar assembly protein FliW [Nocardioides daejeonensis]|uniref:flagellar assembly protein FliW n=1 Tax=Nocardioides daejeonensis TaxID=1046556 RepID=UPI001EF53930|nr:flagellar assembly protein FliW [Nocardioides daejeonensis]